MSDWYLKSGSGVQEFQLSHAYSLGDRMVPRRADAGTWVTYHSGFVWECTTAGTSDSADPTWGTPFSYTPDSSTITSGGATFTCRNPGYSSGSTVDWTFANIYVDYIINNHWTGLGSAGRVLVSNHHNEVVSDAAGLTIDFNQTFATPTRSIVCVDDSAAPATTVATGANIEYVGILFDHFGYIYGITFKSSGNISMVVSSAVLFENCEFHLTNAAGSASRIQATQANNVNEYRNCWVKFAHTGQGFQAVNSSTANSPVFRWRGGGILVGSAAITSLFQGAYSAVTVLEDLDLSAGASNMTFSTGNSFGFLLTARRIKMPASWSVATNVAGGQNFNGAVIDFYQLGSTSGDYLERYSQRDWGAWYHETTLVRAGGSSVSWKMVANGGALFPNAALESGEIAIWNDGEIGITATVEILHDNATALNDRNIWIEAEYLNDSGTPLGSYASGRIVNLLGTGTDWPASSASWTTTGMTNPNKQKLTVTFTPQAAGYVLLRVKLAVASKTVYVDPAVTVA